MLSVRASGRREHPRRTSALSLRGPTSPRAFISADRRGAAATVRGSANGPPPPRVAGEPRPITGGPVSIDSPSETPVLMPAAFFGHGNPMNALEINRYTSAWRAFGKAVPRPRAILVVSAHWYINATAVTAMPRPRTIHDFYGFPKALFDVQYPAPGLPGLAEEVSDVVQPTWVGADVDSWGIDHGTWSVLVHAFPDASIPVVQLSINADKGADHHLELGRKLAPLRERGVLVVASGNVVHNLRGMDWKLTDDGYDWAQRFDEDAKARMLTDPTEFAA